MVNLRRKRFLRGQQQGRNDGFYRGYSDGIARAMQDFSSVFGKALIITPSLALPSLEIIIAQPFRELRSLRLLDYEVREEGNVSREEIEAADIIIFLRNVEPIAYQYLLWAHELNKKTIYVIDDNFAEFPSPSDLEAYYTNPERIEIFKSFMTHAQMIHVGSSYFAEYIRLHYNSKVACFPASVDFALLDSVIKPLRDDGKVIIGYEGTNKEEDFAVVVPVIKQIIQDYGDQVRVQFHGFVPGELAYHPGIDFVTMNMDYRAYLQHLNQCAWDIGLAPLRDTVFNRCKTNNKYREYSACEIPGIYSDSPAYKDWVVHGETGVIVPHTIEGWYGGLKELIEDTNLREKIKNQANHFAREQFSIQQCAENWHIHILHALGKE